MPPPDETRSRLVRRLLLRRRPFIIAASVLLALLSYLTAFWLRAELAFPAAWQPLILKTLPFLLVARLFAFRHYGLLQGWWTGAGMHDFLDIVKSVCVGSALFVTTVVLAFGVYAVPRSVVLIDATILVGLLSGSRVLSRAWARRHGQATAERTLVVGTLPSVEPLVRDLVETGTLPFRPVGIVDLDGQRSGYRLHGVPILGGEEQIPDVIRAERISTVLLALSTREAATVRRIISRVGGSQVSFKIVPPLREALEERLQLSDLRDVEVDDLLGRTEVQLDVAGLREALRGRRVLITGAAGSIGSELARQVGNYQPARLLLVDRSESTLARLQDELREHYPDLELVPRLVDLRNGPHTRRLFEEHRPEIVYHAAAYKHVPMMEMNPVEAVKNNVLGTRDLLALCDAFGADRFILISTDKAVHPINIMGSTKRVAERLLEMPSTGDCRRIAVRFGNVFGSEGSVVPILLRQIREGGPVTITHPDATRYFMTIPEAVQLVLQASAIGRDGEIFVLDMGEPVRILDLATSLIRLAGFREEDIPIRIMGLRPGERLHEEALIDGATRPTSIEKLWVRPANGCDRRFGEEIARLEHMLAAQDQNGILEWLRGLTDAASEGGAS